MKLELEKKDIKIKELEELVSSLRKGGYQTPVRMGQTTADADLNERLEFTADDENNEKMVGQTFAGIFQPNEQSG